MRKIFYLSTCDTCKRILGQFDTSSFELQDIKKSHISADELDILYRSEGSYEALFNKRAIKFRADGWNQKNLSDTDYKDLILSEYTFLKRPAVIVEDKVFVGNSKKTVEALLALLNE